MKFEEELNAAIEACRQAMKVIMDVYHTAFKVEIKEDDSPVTQADKNADKLIRSILAPLFPTYSFLTEESTDDKSRLKNDYVWTIDPLDGTCDFVAHDKGFTCNIALVYKHKAVVGVVGIPTTGEIFYAVEGEGAYVSKDSVIKRIHVSNRTSNLICLTSVFHSNPKEEDAIKRHSDRITTVKKLGSSIKACRIAEGEADLTYRMSDGTKEWDTAAFQIIVEEAGGAVLKFDGKPITYNRDDVYNRGGYMVVNRKENFIF